MNCAEGKGCSRVGGSQGRLHLEMKHKLSVEKYVAFHIDENKTRSSRETRGNGVVSKELRGAVTFSYMLLFPLLSSGFPRSSCDTILFHLLPLSF